MKIPSHDFTPGSDLSLKKDHLGTISIVGNLSITLTGFIGESENFSSESTTARTAALFIAKENLKNDLYVKWVW